MTVRLLTGDCRTVLSTLPDASAQLCVTSPPYFGLRDYGTASWQGGDAECDHKVGRFTTAVSEKQASNNGSGDVQARDACPKCGATRVDQQIGLEPTVEAYVAELVGVFREVRRVLRDDGVLFLNLGDSYAGSWGAQSRNTTPAGIQGNSITNHPKRASNTGTIRDDGLKPKDLIGIPWRVAFALQQPWLTCRGCGTENHLSQWASFPNGRRICPACELSRGHDISESGWYLRSDIIWAKPNPMPESVRDRPTKAHEYIFLLTKKPTYFWDAEAVKEVGTGRAAQNVGHVKGAGLNDPFFRTREGFAAVADKEWHERNIRSVWTIATDLFGDAVPEPQEPAPKPRKEPTRGQGYGAAKGALGRRPDRDGGFDTPESGRNVRSVWNIATAPYAESHFATFPPKLAERCITAGTSEKGACSACGAPWVRVIESSGGRDWRSDEMKPKGIPGELNGDGPYKRGQSTSPLNNTKTRETTGWQPTCPCAERYACEDCHTTYHISELTAGCPHCGQTMVPVPPSVVPCVVLDCFGGAGTVSLVAERLGRDSIYIDLSPAYAEMARKRIYDDAPMFTSVESS